MKKRDSNSQASLAIQQILNIIIIGAIMSLTAKNIIDFILPEYLIVIFFSLISSFLVIIKTIPNTSIILPFLSLSFAMFGLNIVNNIIDVNLDKINKPMRPLPSGRITINEAKFLAFLCIGLSLLFAYFINFISFVIIIAFNIISFLYSVPPIRLKRFLFSDNILGGILYAVFPFLIIWSLSAGDFPIIFMILFLGLIFSIVSIKDIEDMYGEKKYGFSSIPIHIGIKKTIMVSISIILFLLLTILFLSFTGTIERIYFYATIFSFICLFIYSFILMGESKKTEKNIITQSKLMTISMMFVAIVEMSYGIATIMI
jgi:geranylgeranylglycerol-phosphate geranylgeranyltransferase